MKEYYKIFALISMMVLIFFTIEDLKSSDSDEICMECHSDKTLRSEADGKNRLLYINYSQFNRSVHNEIGCTGCHADADPEDLPHDEDLEKVDCSTCHDEVAEKYSSSLHAHAHDQGKYLAPNCASCHTKHNILSHKDPNSPTYVMNIPNLCGKCHKEGTPVQQLKYISQRNILKNYSQSIHGDGLFKRGLTVTAVCTSCHNSHEILPHENPKSTINKKNIPKTCMRCHANIEQVHVKVIEGKLWEEKPHIIPVCIDCHQPHKARKVFYLGSYTNDYCLKCHTKPQFTANKSKEISKFDTTEFHNSVHKNIPCIQCHVNVNPNNKPVCQNSGKVDCSMCHAEIVNKYSFSQHGKLYQKGDIDAPYCTDCHGIHNILSKDNDKSPTYSINIPKLCGNCHREGAKASRRHKSIEQNVLKNYSMSIHGKGLLVSGLVVTATCIDCHTSHSELPASDKNSTVNRDNIPKTCGNCHSGIYEELLTSIHSPNIKDGKERPVCSDCHFAHKINRVDLDDFRQYITQQCGRCHEDVMESYFETFHGKVTKLGSAKTAKCNDCHGSHNILPVSNPKSTLSHDNIIQTCKKCHENSNRKFVGYLTHATHHNKDKYPYLYYTFWFMTILLVGTFTFFGLHTLFWLPRAIKEKRKRRKTNKGFEDGK